MFINVIIVSVHSPLCSTLFGACRDHPELCVVGLTNTLERAAEICGRVEAQVVVVLSEEHEGEIPGFPVPVLLVTDNQVLAVRALAEGVRGVVRSQEPISAVTSAILTLAAGGASIDPDTTSRLIDDYRKRAS